MRKFLCLAVLVVFACIVSACEELDQIQDVQDSLIGGEDIGDDIEHVATIEDEEATVSTYTTDLEMDEAEETFITHMKDEGFEEADQEKELGYFVEFGDAGYGGTLLKDDSNYMYVYISEGSDAVSILSVTAPQEAYESHYEDEDSSSNTGDDLTLPESDEPGEDIGPFPRYEGFMRTHYAEMQDSDTSEQLVEYLGKASVDDVTSHYMNALEDSSLSLVLEGSQGSEYYIEGSNDTFEVKIVVRDLEDDFVEVTIHYLEHL
ncbi:MAG: hypothetical protein ACQEQA_04895 [Bacillota bacterium]